MKFSTIAAPAVEMPTTGAARSGGLLINRTQSSCVTLLTAQQTFGPPIDVDRPLVARSDPTQRPERRFVIAQLLCRRSFMAMIHTAS